MAGFASLARTSVIGLVAGLAIPAVVLGQTEPVEARALEVMRAMSGYLGGLETVSVQVESTLDEVPSFGPTVQHEGVAEALIQRPNRFAISSNKGSGTGRALVYDGEAVTLYNERENVYAVIEGVSGTIDEVLTHLLTVFDITAPLHDLAFNDPFGSMMSGVVEGIYVGESLMQGSLYHHLAFSQEDVDWQVWIATGDRPLPAKMVVTYKRLAGGPQFMGWMKWDTSPKVDDASFAPTPPTGATKIDIIPARAAAALR